MRVNLRNFFGTVATIALAIGQLGLTATPANAFAGAVANGITTTDLNAVGATPLALAQALMGTGVSSISNVQFTGNKAQAGSVHLVDPAVAAFNDALIMSSGNIADIQGPNKSESTTGDMLGGQDTDLTNLIKDTQTVNPMTYDAATLSFDFTPNASDIYFTYTFSSDEYLEWVDLFNDVFAFYVNGTNCATVPNPDPNTAAATPLVPVSIDTINSTRNSNLYRDNSFWSPPANPINIESDGISVELICHAAVNIGVPNHIKLAIADTSDQILDSVVMIKSGSLSTKKPESCNDGVDNDDDLQVDDADLDCKNTTTQPPGGSTGQNSGTGSSGFAPPFTGNEGTPIVLDASKFGWTANAATYTTSWTVTGINGTSATCVIQDENGQPLVYQHVTTPGVIPIAYAVCPKDGEFVAHVWGWETNLGPAGGSSSFDYDVDFFVHNAPPTAELSTPTLWQSYVIGDTVTASAYVADAGVNDTVTCKLVWGDGTTQSVTWDSVNQLCEGTHVYSSVGDFIVTLSAIDNQGDSAASAIPVSIGYGSMQPQNLTWTTAPAASGVYGSSFSVAATSDGSANPVVIAASGGCSLTGSTVTITSGTTGCIVTASQAGDGATYLDATPLVAQVTTSAKAITVTAEAKSKLYGTADPALTYQVTSGSLVGSDAFTGSLTRVAGTALGNYAIQQGSLALSTNYSLSYVGANLNIYGVAPVVTTQPASATVAAGATATFSAAASGTPAPTIQWQVKPVGGSWSNVSGATAGSLSVVTTAADTGKQYQALFSNGVGSVVASNAATLTVTSLAPAITSITPTSGGVGTSVSITGTNLTGATSVKFFGTTTSAVFTVLSSTSIVTSVPVGATTGAIQVTTPGGTASSASFKGSTTLVVPTVTAYSVSSVRTGTNTSVTLTGTNLAGATAVKFNGVSLTWMVKSATSLTATVPTTSAASSAITVTTAGGTSKNTILFTVLPAPVKVAAGASHSCSVLADGTVKCTGLNTNGQLGDGTTTQRTAPVLVSGLSSVGAIAAGAAFSCAVVSPGASGTVKCWGLNSNYQLGDGTTTQRLTPVTVAGVTGAVEVVAGNAFACARLVGGTVTCWGANTNGQLGDGNVTAQTAPVAVSGLSGVTAIAAGGSTACAVASGVVKCWGLNTNGQLGDGTTTQRTTPVSTGITTGVSVAVGASHACAVTSTGGVKCWGLNTSGQLGDGTLTQRLSPVDVKTALNTALGGASTATAGALAAGATHSCVIKGTGSTATLLCWGANASGQLGIASTTTAQYATALTSATVTGTSWLAAGGSHTVAVVPSATLAPSQIASWGLNKNGELGDGSTTNRTSPVLVATL